MYTVFRLDIYDIQKIISINKNLTFFENKKRIYRI